MPPKREPLYIPAYVPPRIGAQLPQIPAITKEAQDQHHAEPTAALFGTSAATAMVQYTPAAPVYGCASDVVVQQAQVEALKLQVAHLRRSNSQLQQQLAAATAERAAAAKQAALQQLAELRLLGDVPVANGAAATASGDAAELDALLQSELGVCLHPAAETVPLKYLQQLHDSFQRQLLDQKQQHEQLLQQRQENHEQQLNCQVERHQREVRALTDSMQDPAREAEEQLLRDDRRYLKDKMQQLGVEYQRRVEVASAEARLTAQRQAAQERQKLEQQAAADQQRLQQQLADLQQEAAQAEAAAADAAALERAQHAAELARLGEQHSAHLGRLKAEFAASLAQREQQYSELLGELRAVRSCMSSAATSRAATRQEQHTAPFGPTAGSASTYSSAAHGELGGEEQWCRSQQHGDEHRAAAAPADQYEGIHWPQQQQQQHHGPAGPGQLMELHSDDEEEQQQQPQHYWQPAAHSGGFEGSRSWQSAPAPEAWPQHQGEAAWEHPRQTPEALQHLKAPAASWHGASRG